MINNINELAEKINIFVNYIVKEACENTFSGNYIFEENDIATICGYCGMDFEDYVKYKSYIEDELISREELLEFDMNDSLIDFMCGLNYCPNYEWCPGDEAIFGSYEEFENRVVKPIEQKKSFTELVDIGKEVINNYPDVVKEIQIKKLISSFAPGQVFCETSTQRYMILNEEIGKDYSLFDIYNNDLEFIYKKFIDNKVVAEEIYTGSFVPVDDKKINVEHKKRKSLDALIKESENRKEKHNDDSHGRLEDIAPVCDGKSSIEKSL